MKALRVAFALLLLPLAAGVLVVTDQDAVMTHLPGRAAIREAFRAGRFPFVHPGASCGEPLAGDPNFGTFFPDTLLLVVLPLPLPVAFGAHFALAAVLAFVGARRWARAEGIPRDAAELAGLTFVLGGVFVSTWKFYNSGMALAVAPWVMAATAKAVGRAARGDARGARQVSAELGVWGGLELLAGEPVVALLTAFLAAWRALAWFFSRPGVARKVGIQALATGAALAALLAAPQIAATGQVLPATTRGRTPFPFVTAAGTSVHPVRLLEQVVPFPFGRPDLRGPGGFAGHRFFDGHAPYLWTLHVGLGTAGLLLLFGRPLEGPARAYSLAALAAVALSLGRLLPAAKKLYPVLSLGGRIRFPVKWWYVVALCLVPLVGWAARRFEAGEKPRPAFVGLPGAHRWLGAALGLIAGAVTALWRPPTALATAGVLASIAGLLALLLLVQGEGPRRLAPLALSLAGSLFVAHLPLLFAAVDRGPASPPRVATGRIYARVRVEAHPVAEASPEVDEPLRDYFRRAAPELWPVTGSEVGSRYAFDDDPDGSYSADDRAVRKGIDALPWPDRAPELRLAGVATVVTEEVLPAPYREVGPLSDRGVRLYALDAPAPAVRFATRIARRLRFEGVLAHHRRPDFDPATDTVLMGGEASVEGQRMAVTPAVLRETPEGLAAEVDAPSDGVLVWSRTFFPAWRATVDGAGATVILADGHLVGVPVPAGRHRVEVAWSGRPLLAGGALFAVGGLSAALLRR